MTLRISHLADIHLRGLSRHTEVANVTTRFIEDAKKNRVDHVFIGGDIFHTKTNGISPEYIDFMNWWLTQLSTIAEVHMILGNHDGNLVNLSRQDAISPIIKALNNKKIHLYKSSGVYQFAPGYNWCVFSLFDEEGWKDVKPVPGDVNIACYHGPVWGATTETGWLVNDGLTVEFFKDYSYVFLGDIHTHQYLGYRDCELVIDEDDLVKYPGADIIEKID